MCGRLEQRCAMGFNKTPEGEKLIYGIGNSLIVAVLVVAKTELIIL